MAKQILGGSFMMLIRISCVTGIQLIHYDITMACRWCTFSREWRQENEDVSQLYNPWLVSTCKLAVIDKLNLAVLMMTNIIWVLGTVLWTRSCWWTWRRQRSASATGTSWRISWRAVPGAPTPSSASQSSCRPDAWIEWGSKNDEEKMSQCVQH